MSANCSWELKVETQDKLIVVQLEARSNSCCDQIV